MGGVLDVLTAGDGPPVPAVEVDWEHAAAATTPKARDSAVKVVRVMDGPQGLWG
jgi:hypothetical protein